MAEKVYHETPLLEKRLVSLIVLEWSGLETIALRGVLEYFNYRVDTHWIGSRKEFIELLKGSIPTQEFIIISCHGDEDEGMYTCPDERPLQPAELIEVAKLGGKTVLSLGCYTGKQNFGDAMLKSGCRAYIAPVGAPSGDTSLMFTIHTFYEIVQHKKSVRDAVESARCYDEEAQMFMLFE